MLLHCSKISTSTKGKKLLLYFKIQVFNVILTRAHYTSSLCCFVSTSRRTHLLFLNVPVMSGTEILLQHEDRILEEGVARSAPGGQ